MPTSTGPKIAKAARKLLNDEGPEAVTMRRVASAVGITPMAVYRHYQGREGLLNALVEMGFEELTSRLRSTKSGGGDVEKRLHKSLDICLDHSFRNPRLCELTFFKMRESAHRRSRDYEKEPSVTLAAELIQEGIESGYFRNDDVREIAMEIGALVRGLIMLYLDGLIGMSAPKFRALCHRSLRRYVNGIRG